MLRNKKEHLEEKKKKKHLEEKKKKKETFSTLSRATLSPGISPLYFCNVKYVPDKNRMVSRGVLRV